MYIARLQLKNFKSFGGSHDLPLSRGFTAIVGPNGSGKSNILDGLRWGLGDSSGIRLRITRQSDLLFQGTALLPPSKFAEVVLELRRENSRSVIKRRFSDEGGSVITVDGARFRLQDLQDFKRDWRLDGERFAFIGQGDVTDAVNCRPMERRLLLEELFGIHLYRKKRDDALLKIESAEGELIRLGALVAELESRKRQIAPAAEKAKRALALEEDMDRSRARWYHLRRFYLENSLDELKEKLRNTDRDREYRKRWKDLWEKGLSDLKDRSRSIEARKKEQESRLSEADEALRTLRRRASQVEISLRLEEDRLDRTNSDARALEARISALESSRESEARECKELTLKTDEAKKSLDDLESGYRAVQREMESQRVKRDGFLELKAKLMTSLEEGRALRDVLSGSAKDRAGSIKDLKNRISALEGPLEALRAEESKLKASMEDLKKEHKDADDLCRSLGLRIQPVRKEIYSLEAEVLSATASEGLYPKAVTHLLAASDLGKIHSRPTPVAEAFDCPPSLTLALEAALGGRQFWLLDKTMDDARDGIEELKRSKAGRATYLTLDRTRPRRPSALPLDLPEKEIIGWAMDIIAVREVWRPAMEHMIGDLLVVASYSAGAALASRGCRFPVVTEDGELFSPGGTVSGGRSGRPGGVLKVRARLKEAEEALKKRRRDLAGLESALKDGEKKEKFLAEALESLAKEVSSAETGRLAKEAALADLKNSLRHLVSQDKTAAEKLKALSSDMARQEAELTQVENGLNSLPSASGHEIREKLSVLRPGLEVLKEKVRSSEARLSAVQRDLDAALSGLSQKSADTEAMKTRIDAQSLALEDLGGLIAQSESEKSAAADSIKALEKDGRRLSSLAERCFERSAMALKKLESLERSAESLEQRKEREKSRLEDLKEAWEAKFPYAGGGGPVGNLDEEERKIRRLEAALRDMGDFDRGSLSEDASLRERLDYYGREMGDVSSAIGELRTLVKDADRNAGTVFKDALDRIDRRFNGLFQRLLGGGEAHLRLRDDGGLWDSGVDIIARPPGRVSSYLSQLSGGEQTLTALSLLFSSMEVAQVPLAVLDEVDASLDEVNLGRFADIVTDYASSVQILAMTHRRQTMERADVMYGVTMSEPGLSQVVGVRPEDWK